MSRTKRGKKSTGYDYHGKRAQSGDCGYGKEVKKITNGKERALAKHLENKAKKNRELE
jgi:hypothetical protein